MNKINKLILKKIKNSCKLLNSSVYLNEICVNFLVNY